MDDRLEKIVNKIEGILNKLLDDFERAPVATGLKVMLILYMIKWVRRNML